MKKRLIGVAFDSMEKNKREYINDDKRYIKADAKVKDILENIRAELPGEKKNLVKELYKELEGQADRRDILIYELGLKQGVVLKATETDVKKALNVIKKEGGLYTWVAFFLFL